MSDPRFGPDRHVVLPGPLPLDGGAVLAPVAIGYATYGDPANPAVLVCHALTGDQHVASTHPVTGKPGWWPRLVGPGKPIDPARHLIVCANVLGSCMGSSGSATRAPDGAPWAMRFPVITIRDMVRAQALLLDHLGIDTVTVVGGSMGGMQALSWAATFPDRVAAAVAGGRTVTQMRPKGRAADKVRALRADGSTSRCQDQGGTAMSRNPSLMNLRSEPPRCA